MDVLGEALDEFDADAVHFGDDALDARGEVVVEDEGGDGDDEAGGGQCDRVQRRRVLARAANFGMREIVGYVPVEPDGSVRAQVPADAPLGLQLVDATGKAVYSRHGAWINLRPGETLQCQGCHANNSPLPHGRNDGMAPSINAGAPLTGQPFPNTRTDVVGFADAGETIAKQVPPSRLEPEPET